ncbi:hypothetical protein CTAYLR_006252 [Chrysophaeum taylorii]|uniref:Uncharacterized protein n=1 Tax=Chrysophaeum taylorii TaxID=2483200 RepID=A0AAD7UK74_9STRA|nr:hypothetical protein CTAYLR_006252 [Chrysophaeum taylorii]
MSLFKARSWWSTKVVEEEFGDGGLAVDGDGHVVTGSLQGRVRVHAPSTTTHEATTLLIEEDLEAPVLAVEFGRLNQTSVALAVLHPRKLCVFGVEQRRDHHELVALYSHKLGPDHFSAYGMCVGGFGGQRGGNRDMILVQSLDCRVVVFDQDAQVLTRRLADCLLPGPVCYSPASDSLVARTSALELLSYKYDAFVASDDDQVPVVVKGITARRAMAADWTLDVGEMVVDIRSAKKLKLVVALGERSLFVVVSASGALLAHRLLEFEPVAICTYDRSPDSEALVVGGLDGRLAIFQLPDCRTLWVARPAHADPPVAIQVCDLPDNKPGMLAVLDVAGRASLQYLGTEPTRDVAVAAPSTERYKDLVQEMRRLKGKLKTIKTPPPPPPSPSEKTSARRRRRRRRRRRGSLLSIRAEVSIDENERPLDDEEDLALVRIPAVHEEYPETAPVEESLLSATARVWVSCGEALDATATLAAPAWVYCEAPARACRVAGTPRLVEMVMYATAKPPASMTARVTATAPQRGVASTFRLPLNLVCRLLVPPTREAKYKLTLDTDREAVSLGLLFVDACRRANLDPADAATAVSFEFWFRAENDNAAKATVLASKKKGSYRVQATAVPALWLVADELRRRVENYWDEVLVSFNDDLPLTDVYAAVDAHHSARARVREAESRLNDATHELRVLEKRILVRFKDSRPAPLHHLDTLLDQSSQRVLQLATKVQKAQADRDRAATILSASLGLFLLLCDLRFSLDPRQSAVLASHFNPDVDAWNNTALDDSRAGWEELTDASLTFFLKTALSTKKNVAALQAPQTLAFPPTTDKLKKHIAMVCDRLERGARPKTHHDQTPHATTKEDDQNIL